MVFVELDPVCGGSQLGDMRFRNAGQETMFSQGGSSVIWPNGRQTPQEMALESHVTEVIDIVGQLTDQLCSAVKETSLS